MCQVLGCEDCDNGISDTHSNWLQLWSLGITDTVLQHRVQY